MNDKKYFIVSDIHSFFTYFKQNLQKAGFRKTNKNHILIICGDLFDRGYESVELYNYLKTLPKKRLILIKGNHESLLLDCLAKSYPSKHDFSNGTVRTLCHFAEIGEEMLDKYYWYNFYGDTYRDWEVLSKHISNKLTSVWNKIKTSVLESEFYKWLTSNLWVDYYELDNFIFTHSFIPVKCDDPVDMYYSNTDQMEYIPEWRTKASPAEFEDAKWGCPYKLFMAGLFDKEIDNNKVLVCGHWQTAAFHKVFQTKGAYDDYDIYFGDNLIALDACTPYSKKVNVLVYDMENCFDQYNNLLI